MTAQLPAGSTMTATFFGRYVRTRKAQSLEYGVQYAKAMEKIDELKQLSPKVKNLTKFENDAKKFDKGMEQMKSSKVFQSLAKDKENLQKIAGMGSARKMTETLLKSYKNEKDRLEEAAKAAEKTEEAKKQRTTTNEKKKENVAVV